MRRFAVLLIFAASGCDSWSSVHSSYCSHHSGVGDRAAGGQGGGSGGGTAATGGGSPSGDDDGGPPVEWVRVLGGVHDDDALSLALDPFESHLAVGGHFLGAIDLGGATFIGLGGNTLQGMFVAQLDPSDGGTTDGIAVSCSSTSAGHLRHAADLHQTLGSVLASTCYALPATFISRDGVTLALDGGLVSAAQSDAFMLRLGATPALQYLNTESPYEPDKRVIATAAEGLPYFMLAVDTRGGVLLFGDAGVTDGGSSPVLARIGAFDLQPQGVDTIDCPGTNTVEWENVAADPSGQNIFGVIHSTENPMNLECSSSTPDNPFSSGAGTINPGLHRFVYVFSNAGDRLQGIFGFGDTLPDAGPLLLASDQSRSVYFAGYATGSVQDLELDAGALLAGNFDPNGATLSAVAAYAPAIGSSANFVGLSVVPGVSPDIWVLGTVTGTLLDGSGATVVARTTRTPMRFC